MKIIDLLNKIAKGEEVPENIEFRGEIFSFYKGNYTYCDENNCDRWLFDDLYEILDILNDKVEILEDNMSKADEMFNELGYKKIENSKNFIKYKSTKDFAEIWFDITDKAVSATDEYSEGIFITMQELQAINEKVKELGWNE